MAVIKREPVLNPRWIKASMSLQQAGNQAGLRGYRLDVSWNSMMGLRVVAHPNREIRESQS